MKFLFTVQPLFGHFHAMVPLALALKDHGHEVAFATGQSFGSTVQRVGFQHFPCGLDLNSEPNGIFETLPNWETVTAKYPSVGAQQVYGFVQALGPRLADDVIALMKTWRPDVIIRDPLEFGGYIAAESLRRTPRDNYVGDLHQSQALVSRGPASNYASAMGCRTILNSTR